MSEKSGDAFTRQRHQHAPAPHPGPVFPELAPISHLHFPGHVIIHLPYLSREISFADATKLPSQEQSSLGPLIIQSYKGTLRCDWKAGQYGRSSTENERHNVHS